MKCPKCGTENPPDSKYCQECKAPLPQDIESEISPTKTLTTPTEELTLGSTLAGRYQIIEELGKGGMGIVYKAQDRKLKRTVALKFLAPELIRDKEAKERFVHEAQAASGLDHPNICTVHEVDEAEGQMFIAMAYIKGKSLKEKIEKGPLKLDEALDIAIQVAEGLHEAHEKEIVHRDIKSSNIMVTAKGQAKIMDFGVAKLSGRTKFTKTGTTLGTVAYMSPEQTRGEKVDHRADIWSLGVLLYEMVIGQLPFRGDHEQAVVYSILNEEPEPMTGLRTGVPMELEWIVNKALTKDPASRFQHVDEIPVDLKALKDRLSGIMTVAKTKTVAPKALRPTLGRRLSSWGLAGLILGAVVAVVAGIWIGRSLAPEPSRSVAKLEISLPEGLQIDSAPAISPDGRTIAYTASQGGGSESNLYLRSIDETEARIVPDSGGASEPFFSPDGSNVAFFTSDKLLKASVSGGQPIELAASPMDFGGSWGSDDMILFVPDLTGGIFRIPAAGGEPEPIITPDVSKKAEYAYTWPQHLPDGKHVLFYVWGGKERSGTALLSLETKQWQFILPDRYARYVPSGHITIYDNTSATLRAAAFDPETPVVLGDDVPILNDFFWKYQKGREYVAFSAEGTMIYAAGNPQRKRLAWIDSAGEMVPVDDEWRAYSDPKISPDGFRVAFLDEGEIWIKDLRRGISSRIETADRGLDLNFQPLWSSNNRLIFASNRSGDWELYGRELDGKTPAEILLRRDGFQHLESIAPDGTIAFWESDDLWLLRPGDDPEPYLVTSFSTWQARFSPDGKLIVYISNETGRPEVYIQRLDGSDKRIRVSLEGGWDPAWSPDGRILYYRRGKELWAAQINPRSLESVERPRLLKSALMESEVRGRSYDVAPDGRILVIQPHPDSVPDRLNVVLNWFEELKRLVPPGK